MGLSLARLRCWERFAGPVETEALGPESIGFDVSVGIQTNCRHRGHKNEIACSTK